MMEVALFLRQISLQVDATKILYFVKFYNWKLRWIFLYIKKLYFTDEIAYIVSKMSKRLCGRIDHEV